MEDLEIIPLENGAFQAALKGLPLDIEVADLEAVSGLIDATLFSEIEAFERQGVGAPEALAVHIAVLRVHLAKAMQLKAAMESTRH